MILITDDTPENIFSLKRLLELNQFEVDTAHSGEEALRKILKNEYSLLILDVQMPGMDGFEVAEALKGLNKSRDLPIIFLSAISKGKEFVTKGYTSGAVDYLTKPVDADVFILKVRTLHALYEQKRELTQAHSRLKREVEERKKAEVALKKTVAEMQLFMESLPQLAFSANTAGELEFVNQQWLLFAPDKSKFPTFDDIH
ncbi:MAG: response regulator [Proteobacteria bacterium]|nr:MAG: response regulator [Pseudomonadota bacterium]